MTLTPGLYRAAVRGIPGKSIVMVGANDNQGFSLAPDGDVRRCYVFTDARPLVTLDLENPAEMVHILRGVGIEGERNHRAADGTWAHIINGSINAKRLSIIADQIEAQTKPARIPEPGFGETVLASQVGECDGSDRTWVRFSIDRLGWIDWLGHIRAWSDLENPVLS
jgi:hypothetical protein